MRNPRGGSRAFAPALAALLAAGAAAAEPWDVPAETLAKKLAAVSDRKSVV